MSRKGIASRSYGKELNSRVMEMYGNAEPRIVMEWKSTESLLKA